MNGEKIGGDNGGDMEMKRGKMIWNEELSRFEDADATGDPERDAFEFKKKVEEGKQRAEAERKAKKEFEERVKFYQEHPEQIVQLTKDDPEKAQFYRENPDKIDQLLQEVDAKAETYKEAHPEVVQEVGHQTTEAVDIDEAWEAYAEGTINPEVAEQRAAVDEYNAEQAEITADEEKARREEQFEDAIHYWTGVEREKGPTAKGDIEPLTAAEFADHASDGGDPKVLLENWKEFIITQRANAQKDLAAGKITQEEYEQLQKNYEDALAKNEAAYQEYAGVDDKNPDIAVDDPENLNLKAGLKEKVNAEGNLIESKEDSGTKKGFWAWLGRRIGDERTLKIRKAILTAGLVATSFLAGMGVVKTAASIAENQSAITQEQDGNGAGEDSADMTDQEALDAIAAAEAVEPMSPQQMAEAIDQADEQAERERFHSVKVELPGGEIIEVNYEDHRGGYDETQHSWNDADKISYNATSGVLFEGQWTPGQSEEQVLEGFERVLGVSPEESILLLTITGQLPDINSLQDMNTLSATLQEGDTDSYDALVNAAKNYLGEQMNNGRVNFFDVDGAYHTTYTARDGSGRFMIYSQPDQRHNETVHAFDIINEEGVAMLNNADTLAKVKELLGISVDENVRLGISGHCSQIVVEWIGGKGVEFAKELTQEETQNIVTSVTTPEEKPGEEPKEEKPGEEPKEEKPEDESGDEEKPDEPGPVPGDELQPKGDIDTGDTDIQGKTELIEEAEVIDDGSPDIEPGSQVVDVITDNPDIVPDTSGWQEGAPAEEGAPVITEASVESEAAPESAGENTPSSTDQELADRFSDRF